MCTVQDRLADLAVTYFIILYLIAISCYVPPRAQWLVSALPSDLACFLLILVNHRFSSSILWGRISTASGTLD